MIYIHKTLSDDPITIEQPVDQWLTSKIVIIPK